MLLDAARAIGIDRARSWMIGDIADDVEAGHRAGCRTVLVGQSTLAIRVDPDLRAADLTEAASLILSVDAGST